MTMCQDILFNKDVFKYFRKRGDIYTWNWATKKPTTALSFINFKPELSNKLNEKGVYIRLSNSEEEYKLITFLSEKIHNGQVYNVFPIVYQNWMSLDASTNKKIYIMATVERTTSLENFSFNKYSKQVKTSVVWQVWKIITTLYSMKKYIENINLNMFRGTEYDSKQISISFDGFSNLKKVNTKNPVDLLLQFAKYAKIEKDVDFSADITKLNFLLFKNSLRKFSLKSLKTLKYIFLTGFLNVSSNSKQNISNYSDPIHSINITSLLLTILKSTRTVDNYTICDNYKKYIMEANLGQITSYYGNIKRKCDLYIENGKNVKQRTNCQPYLVRSIIALTLSLHKFSYDFIENSVMRYVKIFYSGKTLLKMFKNLIFIIIGGVYGISLDNVISNITEKSIIDAYYTGVGANNNQCVKFINYLVAGIGKNRTTIFTHLKTIAKTYPNEFLYREQISLIYVLQQLYFDTTDFSLNLEESIDKLNLGDEYNKIYNKYINLIYI